MSYWIFSKTNFATAVLEAGFCSIMSQSPATANGANASATFSYFPLGLQVQFLLNKGRACQTHARLLLNRHVCQLSTKDE